MGLSIVLEDEQREALATVLDPTNVLHRLLPRHEDSRYRYLADIDWYGNTTFNRLQADRVRQEFAVALKEAESDEGRGLVAQIDALLLRCQSEPHLYVTFYGD